MKWEKFIHIDEELHPAIEAMQHNDIDDLPPERKNQSVYRMFF